MTVTTVTRSEARTTRSLFPVSLYPSMATFPLSPGYGFSVGRRRADSTSATETPRRRIRSLACSLKASSRDTRGLTSLDGKADGLDVVAIEHHLDGMGAQRSGGGECRVRGDACRVPREGVQFAQVIDLRATLP